MVAAAAAVAEAVALVCKKGRAGTLCESNRESGARRPLWSVGWLVGWSAVVGRLVEGCTDLGSMLR